MTSISRRQRPPGSCERTTSNGGGGTYTMTGDCSGRSVDRRAVDRGMRLIASPPRRRQGLLVRFVDCDAVILDRSPLLPMPMLWIKALHVIFVVTWFAGLFYLPRLFIYHVETTQPAVREQLIVMERRLLMITHIGAAAALVFGLAALAWWLRHDAAYLHQGWLVAKLVLVAGLIGYHAYLVRLKNQLAANRCTRSSRWLRVFNEVPGVLLIAIVILVVVKP
ncbi:MAG TPA: CopD family protein [Acetobacteraceae bacterium]|nr:CopD family protein [Acetobacteraceae bacterium]